MRTRIRNWVKQVLQEKPRTVRQIVDRINEKQTHGTTVKTVNNIVSKDPGFKVVGETGRHPVYENKVTHD